MHAEHSNNYTDLFHSLYDLTLPYWDELTMFAALYPEHVTNSTSCKYTDSHWVYVEDG